MKYLSLILAGFLLFSCTSEKKEAEQKPENPFYTELNQPIPYSEIGAADIEAYGKIALERAISKTEAIKSVTDPDFDNIIRPYDEMINEIGTASSNCFMLYWVSPDSLSRIKGYEAYQKFDSLFTALGSDKQLYDQIVAVSKKGGLEGSNRKLVDDMITSMKHSGVNLEADQLDRYKELNSDLNGLTSQYSINMNTDGSTVVLDKAGAEGLPENFKSAYLKEDGTYEIPTIPATSSPVLSNASNEQTRKDFYMKYFNRAADKNLDILNQLVSKRHEIGQIMGHDTYAGYNLEVKMAKNPENVWNFINDLIERSADKAEVDLQKIVEFRNSITGQSAAEPLSPWNYGYYRNQLLKNEYQVDHEKIREYLVMDNCLKGMMELYQELLGLEFRKVENPSVWHEEVEMYEVYEDGQLSGRFYLDLFPRPNKESWFYGVPLTSGKQHAEGYEVPVAMLLGNFTRPTDDLPSLLSHGELNTLFHEFGHIMDGMSYKGEFSTQSNSKADFVESMSQIFENWIWDYDILKDFATHYESGEVLPEETFNKMVAAKNVTSGLSAQGSLRRCVYDMMLYDQYDPENPMATDDIWRTIDSRFVMPTYVEGTHPQSSWIHINTHPVYMYGYLWSEVYAQDMFTQFEENGLRDAETGKRYRQLILANGSQRDIEEALDEFLGRSSNNEAYIKSLGL